MFFRIKTNEYCYYIALKDNEVISESLYRKAVTGKKTALIFERETPNIKLGYTLNKKSINTSVNPKMPYLSFLRLTMIFLLSVKLSDGLRVVLLEVMQILW